MHPALIFRAEREAVRRTLRKRWVREALLHALIVILGTALTWSCPHWPARYRPLCEQLMPFLDRLVGR